MSCRACAKSTFIHQVNKRELGSVIFQLSVNWTITYPKIAIGMAGL